MTTTTKSRKAQAAIIVLATYIFTSLSRICFTVRSSDGTTTYMTCFDNGHGACTCDGNAVWHHECKHIKHLAPIAAQKLAQLEAKEAARHAVAEAETIVTSTLAGSQQDGNSGYFDAEYEEWKRATGKPAWLSREAYTQEFSIY